MARKPLDINSSCRGELLVNIEQVVTRRKYLLLLQEANGVVLHRATPKGIHLEQRIRGLSIGVFWVERANKASRLAVQKMIDYRPLACRPKPHGRVEPLWALRPRRSHWGRFNRPVSLPKCCFGGRNLQLQGGRTQAKGCDDEDWGNDQT